jgi:type II secretion system protein N
VKPKLLVPGEFIASRLTVGARTGLHLIGYGVFAAILFLALVSANFPYAEAISSVLAPMGVKIGFERQLMNFPIGAQLQNVRLISAANQQLLIQSPNVKIAPVITRLLLGQLCLNVRAEIFGGVLDAIVRGGAQSETILDFQLESLNLAKMSKQTGTAMLRAHGEESQRADPAYTLGGILSGELSGRGSAELTGSDISAARASLFLLGRDIKALVATGLPPLDLGMVGGRVLLEQGIATLQNVRAYGRYGNLAANGVIQLGPDMPSSTLRLTLWLKPTPNGRATFGTFLNMLPHSPGTGPYYLEGTLEFPTVS